MVGRIYGTTSCGSHGLGEDFLANDSKASIDNMSMDGRIYVGDHKTYRLRAKKGPAPPPREFCRHILS